MDIIERQEWLARSPKSKRTIALPTLELWLHHTAGSESGATGMRAIQDFHKDVRKWWDIGYSFVVDPTTLFVYEGRGAGVQGGHTEGHNTISHGICVMGNFSKEKPSERLLAKLGELVQHGHREGWWPDQLSGGHRDTKSTECPGNNLYDMIPEINIRSRSTVKFPETGVPTKIDRLAERVWNMEMLALIDWAYRFYLNRTGSREELNSWLEVAKEQDPDTVIQAIADSEEARG